MRELHGHQVNGANSALHLYVTDEPGPGGANHAYSVEKHEPGNSTGLHDWKVVLKFQHGPIAEHGVNGLTQEVLLEVVADRLRSFQAGPYACRENAIALTHLETAQLWLHKRTLDRLARGVEGTNAK